MQCCWTFNSPKTHLNLRVSCLENQDAYKLLRLLKTKRSFKLSPPKKHSTCAHLRNKCITFANVCTAQCTCNEGWTKPPKLQRTNLKSCIVHGRPYRAQRIVVAMYTQNLNSNSTYKFAICVSVSIWMLARPVSAHRIFGTLTQTTSYTSCVVVCIVFVVLPNSSFSATSHIFWLWYAFDWQAENGTMKQHTESAGQTQKKRRSQKRKEKK